MREECLREGWSCCGAPWERCRPTAAAASGASRLEREGDLRPLQSSPLFRPLAARYAGRNEPRRLLSEKFSRPRKKSALPETGCSPCATARPCPGTSPLIPFSRRSDGRSKTGRRQSRLPLCLEHLETRAAPSGNTLATAVLLPIPPSGRPAPTAYLAQPADVELYAVSLNRGARRRPRSMRSRRPWPALQSTLRVFSDDSLLLPPDDQEGGTCRPHVSGPAGRHVLPGRQFRRQ